MAKGKHATALFEVIHRSKGLDRPRHADLRPRAHVGSLALPRAAAASDAGATRHSWLNLLRLPGRRDPEVGLAAAAPDMPRFSAATAMSAKASTSDFARAPAAAPSKPRPAVVDANPTASDAQPGDAPGYMFKLTYTSAVVAASALTILVALAFVIGRTLSQDGQPLPTGVPSVEELRAGPASREVLDVRKGAARVATAPSGSGGTARPVTIAGEVPLAAAAAAPVPSAGDRVVGRQYVIVQSYGREDLAKAAQDVLSRNGIETTIERGVKGYAEDPKWFIVVTTQGFDTIRDNKQYEQLVRKIRTVGDQFAATGKNKPFAGVGARWKGPNNGR